MLKLITQSEEPTLAVHIALEWTGLAYEIELTSGWRRWSWLDTLETEVKRTPGLYVTPGFCMTSTYAALMYLHRLWHSHQPNTTHWDLYHHGVEDMLAFLSCEVQPSFEAHFQPEQFHPDSDEHSIIQQASYKRLSRLLHITDDSLTNPYLLGDQPCVADAFLYVMIRWLRETPIALQGFPLIEAFERRMEQDSAVRRVLSSYADNRSTA